MKRLTISLVIIVVFTLVNGQTAQELSSVRPNTTSADVESAPSTVSSENKKGANKDRKAGSNGARKNNSPAPEAEDDPVNGSQNQSPATGDEGEAELAKKLANPLASLISLPIQINFDFGMGTGSGWRMTTNVQPVIPVALNKDWNLISRTIVPIIHQGNVIAPGGSQNGLGDIVQSLFLSPNKSEPVIWGVGPVVLIPTATNQFLGAKQLGLGPTAVVLKQQKGWTVGALWNHVWRVAGGSDRPKVNSDFIQPILSYSTRDGWTYSLNTESTYDWTRHRWGVPIHGQVAKIVRFGKQPVSFGGGIRCWATSPPGGPEGCGLRIVVTGIFPKKG